MLGTGPRYNVPPRGGSRADGPLMGVAAALSREQALTRLFQLGQSLQNEGHILEATVALVRREVADLLAELGRLQEALRE